MNRWVIFGLVVVVVVAIGAWVFVKTRPPVREESSIERILRDVGPLVPLVGLL